MLVCVTQIGHLAEVVDTDIAVVLSWHMSADMDCIVTVSTRKVLHRLNLMFVMVV